MPEKKVEVKKRRFLAKDYDFIAEHVCKEHQTRSTLQDRKDHEALWKEVDRQVKMKPMEVVNKDPDLDWKAALEMGDMATAYEVLSADVLRLIFPQDRRSLAVHVNIDFDRLQNREAQEIPEEEKVKVQKKADSELRAMMTQQHKDFGLRQRIEMSVKEALKHGSFVAEAQWEAIQQYAMGGVFKSNEAPVWEPHSMWNCFPETLNLGVNMIYTGSMIIQSEKDYDWVMRQTQFINTKALANKTTDTTKPLTLLTYYGNLTVKRQGESVYLPNMKVTVVKESRVVIYAKPMNSTAIIFGGYDRVDIRDPYYMSPLVKQSTNHRIVTTIANKFLDNVELKLEPPTVYDGNDPTLVAQGGPKIIPGSNTPTKGGVQNFKQIDVGDPSWAAEAIIKFQGDVKEGTGVSSSRAGAQRQADRVTATQIEEESVGSQVRTIDFVGKVEKGIESFCYIQHEMNKDQLDSYKFYNADMGMKDFDEIKGSDLPKEVHFEMVGSKGLLTERRRAQATSEVMAFLMSNERTASLPKLEEMARQMLLDAGNKNPEQLLNLSDTNSQHQQQIEALKQQMQVAIQEMQEKLKELAQKLVQKEMELKNSTDQLKLRNERAEGTETSLREEIRKLKADMARNQELTGVLNDIKKEVDRNEEIKSDTETAIKVADASKDKEAEPKEPAPTTPQQPPVVVNIERAGGYKINRDENGDMDSVDVVNEGDGK